MTATRVWRLRANGRGPDGKRVIYDELHQGDAELDDALTVLEGQPGKYSRPRASEA